MIEANYRPISPLAVLAGASSALSLLAFLHPFFLLFALFAIPLAIGASIHARAQELCGGRCALFIAGVATIVVIAAPMWHMYLYRVESLAGYERVDFAEALSQGLDSYAERDICLKGYPAIERVSPGTRTIGFSPDGSFRLKDGSIRVCLPSGFDPHQHAFAPLAISGKLAINPLGKFANERYIFVAKEVRSVNSRYGIKPRSRGDGC